MLGPLLFAMVGQVGLDAPAPLAGRLALRLLDEQLDVVPPRTGASNLRINTSSTAIRVVVAGARTVEDAVDASQPAVAELELFHRSVLALRAAGTVTTTRAPALVLVELGELALEAREQIALAVLDANLGLTASSTRASAVLCVELGKPIAVGASRVGTRCDVEPVSGPLSPAVKRAVASVLVEPPQPPASSWWILVRAAGGATGRASAIDPTAALGLAIGRSWAGGRLDALVLSTSEPEVTAFEILLAAGPELRFSLERWRFSIGARAGVLLHRYDVERSTSGLRADFAADLPLGVAFRIPPVALELQLVPGLAARDRRHRRGEEVLWERGAARLIGLFGLTWESPG